MIKVGALVEILDGIHAGEQGRVVHLTTEKAEVSLDRGFAMIVKLSRLVLVDVPAITPTTEGTPMQGMSQPDAQAAASILVESAVDVDGIQEYVDSAATELEDAQAAVAAARAALVTARKVLPGLQREALAIARLKLSSAASVAELRHRAGRWASK